MARPSTDSERPAGTAPLEVTETVEPQGGAIRGVLGACRIGTWQLDRVGGVLSLDRTAMDLLGMGHGPKAGGSSDLMEQVHPEDRATLGRMLGKGSSSGAHIRYAFRLLRPSGKYRWLEMRATSGEKWEGSRGCWSGILQDVSHHQALEENLFDKYSRALDRLMDQGQVQSREEQFVEGLLETTSECIFLAAGDGEIHLANSAAGRLFGTGGRLAEGVRVSDLFFTPSLQMPEAEKSAGRCATLEAMVSRPGEWYGRSHAGEPFPVELVAKPLGDHSLCLLVARDTCHQRWLEAEVERAELRERHAIACDLHDSVCQDLTVAGILVQSLGESGYWDNAVRLRNMTKLCSAIAKSQEGLRRIMARIKPMEVPRETLPQALRGLAEQVSQDGGLTCRYEGPDALALPDDETATNLYLVAREAVNNAIRHSGAKAIEINLRPQPTLQLAIQDDGKGLERTPKPRGIGLAMLRDRVKAMGARLAVGPAQPKGTVVSCELG